MKLKKFFFLTLFFSALYFQASAQTFFLSLQVSVIDAKGNVVPDATVKLYKSEADYMADKNAIVAKDDEKTNKRGRITFTKLETKEYFIRAEKGNMSNMAHGYQCSKLDKNRINKVNIIISE